MNEITHRVLFLWAGNSGGGDNETTPPRSVRQEGIVCSIKVVRAGFRGNGRSRKPVDFLSNAFLLSVCV